MKKILICIAAVIVCAAAAAYFYGEHSGDGACYRINSFDKSNSIWHYSVLSEEYENGKVTEDKSSVDYRRTAAPPAEAEGMGDLKAEIQAYISSRAGEWGVYVKNLQTNEYLSINEHDYSSASLIKLFTMAATCNEVAAGTISYDGALNSNLREMITKSSNTACNYLTKRLGGGNTINGFNVENKNTRALGCTYTNHGSELVDGTGRKVTFTGFNRTSPRDCGIVLENVYRRTLVSEETSDDMLELLKGQVRTHKIPAALPDGTVTANKTGETNKVEADSAIVFSPSCDYIICVIGNGSIGSGIETIHKISRMTYDYMNAPKPEMMISHGDEETDGEF